MKYLVLLTPVAGKTPDQFAAHMVAEIKHVWESYTAGELREFYFSPDPQAVTLIYEMADRAAVEREVTSLPLIKAGLLDAQIVQLGSFPQLSVLFDKALIAP
ncbi:hypothetical protein [Gluconobacter frateurii]|uniref:Superoxide dismutase n=1 Tax=Gluconobacter frateurii NRIC 0228 TaxID=1307946 RepID=A0ABQ0Q967_9PROT|nr:hypothetical protein [Gluconobacter frateurii]UMM07837.1 hypothetical protein MKW11_11495 [Gluconobacter frateurii]GBR09659.1 hypothetical protein AA0228_0749 [Gluconobacter frateurii NRIC 0228]GLP91889.1 hypothetical protein GCM10007868_29640 [Gluconobacter frateurii]